MKKIFLAFSLICLSNAAFTQQDGLYFKLKVPLQCDVQRATEVFSYGSEIKKGHAVNFGVDALIEYQKNAFSVYSGVGYFRDRFNIKRGYDHKALNPLSDSLPIGTDTKFYTYSLVRIPIGFIAQISKNRNREIGLGCEYFFNYSFCRKYNGRLPFEGANTTYKGFNSFGNELHLLLAISTNVYGRAIAVEPFTRIYNIYRKDRFLREKEKETVTRFFDSYGISIRYSIITLKKKS